MFARVAIVAVSISLFENLFFILFFGDLIRIEVTMVRQFEVLL